MKHNKIIDKGDHYEVILNSRDRECTLSAKVDKNDWPYLNICSWSNSNTTKRPQGFVKGKLTTMHQVLMGKKEGFVIDHINHDGYDNRRKNLRFATKSQNGMNQKGVLGITLCKPQKSAPNWKKRWLMQIQALDQGGKKVKKSSYHYTKEEAILARKQAEQETFGEFMYKGNNYGNI